MDPESPPRAGLTGPSSKGPPAIWRPIDELHKGGSDKARIFRPWVARVPLMPTPDQTRGAEYWITFDVLETEAAELEEATGVGYDERVAGVITQDPSDGTAMVAFQVRARAMMLPLRAPKKLSTLSAAPQSLVPRIDWQSRLRGSGMQRSPRRRHPGRGQPHHRPSRSCRCRTSGC